MQSWTRALRYASCQGEPLLAAALKRAKPSSLFSSIQVTLISAFVFPQLPPKPVNIFFAFCISLCCISAGILVSTATFAVQAFECMTEDEIRIKSVLRGAAFFFTVS